MTVPTAQLNPVALFVLGMPRSGTSALTRVLSLCGATLPAGMLGADSGNPRGYWEPRKALRLNNSILLRHGSGTYDPSLRLQEEGALDDGQKAAYVAEISAYLDTLPDAPLVIIKDLQITALSDVWFEATRLAGFDIAIVIAVRHPKEVIASLAKLMRAQPELSCALWLKYNLLAERQTRGMRRVFVEYANLLGNWHEEIARISTALSIDLSDPGRSRDRRVSQTRPSAPARLRSNNRAWRHRLDIRNVRGDARRRHKTSPWMSLRWIGSSMGIGPPSTISEPHSTTTATTRTTCSFGCHGPSSGS